MAWQAAIGLGIGDDDTVDGVAETEHVDLVAARAWVERVLPVAEFPVWVHGRPHGTAGAFLYGTVGRGWYARQDDGSLEFEPDPDGPVWDADLIDGTLRWRKKSS
ncbi:hypothetical protein [Kutzneria sp. NPDC051319]|uniref:hypothetical protein n=1 Tax=Kutzneria sp. NPDC051319 TaxID=3155047 RepID=UPI00341FCCB6